MGGLTVLTDPNFLHRGERARLGMGLRSERLTEPAMSIDELPSLDAVVLSHHHGDHFDDVATRELDRDVTIVSTHHALKKLRREGFRALVGLEPWQQHVLDGRDATLRITAVPGQHAPRPAGWLIPPVIGTLWDLERAGDRVLRLYVTGDTLVHDGLREIAERFPLGPATEGRRTA